MTTSFRKTAQRAAAPIACILLLAGCNIFNPTGSGKTSDLGNNAKLIEAENLLRDKENSKAAQLYREVIESDSTKSKAYFGLAKAQLRMHDVDAPYVLEFIKTFDENGEQHPFLTATKHMRTVDENQIAGIELAHATLGVLARRDTLQQRFELDGTVARGYSASDYPLSDRIITYSRISLDIELLAASKVFNDLSKISVGIETCVPFVDQDCDLGEATLFKDAIEDTALQDSVNQILERITANLDELEFLSLDMLNANHEGVIGNIPDSSQQDYDPSVIQATVDSLKTTVAYYRFQDRKDNDGDGCVDEEILDGKDNDGDGLKDEDLRATAFDFFDNDRNGTADDDGEALGPDDVLGFIAAFRAAGKIGPEFANLLVRNAIVTDDGTAYPLARRQELVGACWWNYTSLDM